MSTTSTLLNETDNKIHSEGACALGEALKVNKTLITLDFNGVKQ